MSFVGPLALALPVLALLLATPRPMVGPDPQIVLAALIEYGVSAVFGLITFLGGVRARPVLAPGRPSRASSSGASGSAS